MIFILRHGQTDWNLVHRIQGCGADIPLNDTGREQAQNRARIFDGRQFDALITSPLSRAVETGAILTENARVGEVLTDERLKERDFRHLDGTQTTGMPLSFYLSDIDGIEPTDELFDRLSESVRDLAGRDDGDVMIVSHGAAVGTWIAKQLGGTGFELHNLACSTADKDGKLDGYNLEDYQILAKLEQKTDADGQTVRSGDAS